MDFEGGLQMPHVSQDYLLFFGMVMLALALSKTKIGWPLKWAETFYHEVSHGLICNLTGGDVVRLDLNFDGSGCCTTRGGWRVPTLLAGYLGAALWGGVLYMAGWMLGSTGATLWLKLELAFMAFVFLIWARGWRTWLIMLMISSVYAAAVFFPKTAYLPVVLQFIGIYVLLNAIRAPLFLIDGKSVGDGADLARIFIVLPEIFWIVLWFVFALAVLAVCMATTLPGLEHLLGCWNSTIGCVGSELGRLL